MFDNGYGYFSKDGCEYIIKTPKTPRPWINVISNGDYGVVVSNTGSGYSWRTHASLNRITRWNQDLIRDNWGKYIYIRDAVSGEFWSPTWKPVCATPQQFELSHGLGYSEFRTRYFDISSRLRIFVARESPVEIWALTLRNDSEVERKLSVFTYLEWNLGAAPDWHREFHRSFIETEYDEARNCILARKRLWELMNEKGQHWNRDWEYTAFFASNLTPQSKDGSKENFVGKYGELNRPKAVIEDKLHNTFGNWEDPIASLKHAIILNPGEEKTIVYLLGAVSANESLNEILEKYTTEEAINKELEGIQLYWKELLGKFSVETPDRAFNIMNNVWLKYQAVSGRLWGRTAYYQTGGAYGFRDQLQDSQIFLYLNPEFTREQIKLHARHQFSSGIVYHWWHPISEEGNISGYSDDLLWLPFITVRYLKETGDFEFLREKVPFCDGGDGTVYEHCVRAIDNVLSRFGEHNLPLIGTGDWNDGMNAVGTGGKGESIWVGHFLYGILRDFEVVNEAMEDFDRKEKYAIRARALKEAINEHGWDGKWYLRAYKDSGEPIGSSRNQEGKIYLNAQTWAILNDIAPDDRKKTAYESAKGVLFRKYGPILFYPAYSVPDPEIGYLTRYAPGMRENGGLYTHAGTWAVLAAAKMGDPETYAIYRSFMPVYRGLEPDKYMVEPYVTPGNVDGPDSPYFGRGGWSWYTGSATWYFIAGIEGVLGIIPTWEGLKINPVIPENWDQVSVKRLFRGVEYNIIIKRTGEKMIFVCGNKINGNIVVHPSDKKFVDVEVHI